MSLEELKVRKELELDVDSDLEQEIKDGIYHLALRLHRLYQHQKQRTLMNKPTSNHHISEVNINIKLEGGTIIQTKEIKKGAPGNTRLMIPNPNPKPAQTFQGKIVPASPSRIKFDWAQTLRSGLGPLNANPTMEDKNQDKVRGKYRGIKSNASLEQGWKW